MNIALPRCELVEEKLSWQEAQNECRRRGGSLVTIESAEESKMLWKRFGEKACTNFWIGYNDLGDEGTWAWASSSPPPKLVKVTF